MLKLFKSITMLVVLVGLILGGCRKSELDEYYGRPEWLEDPIYKQLEAKGNFTSLLKLIDLAGYKETLSKAGYWTMFAPNDEAFEAFLQENSIANVDAITKEMAEKIVKYALVYNAFRTDHISDFQSNTGWIPNMSFKRRTAYYDGVYKETATIDNVTKEILVIASNRNNRTVSFGTPYYVNGDNNNKYLTYLHSKYALANSLTAEDYNFFYPNDTYVGFNLLGGSVKNADIISENGIIHEVTKVNLPRPNLDQYLATKPEYSFFRDSILNRFFVKYVKSVDASKNYEYLTGEKHDVYIKVYDPQLAFSLNNENYLKETDNDGQKDGYSMFIPHNDVLIPFIRNVILENYSSLNTVPREVLLDIVNGHSWQNTVWPSKFETTFNLLEEPARFNKSTNILDKQILSNGVFYGTNKVQEINVFNTVYKFAYLHPSYSMMVRALNKEYKRIINNPDKKFTLFMISDEVLTQMGFSFNIITNEWSYTNRLGNVLSSALAESRLQRILYNHIVYTPQDELKNIENTSGYIRTGDDVMPGEYIKWNNNKVYAAGNEFHSTVVNIVGSSNLGNNGRVFYTDNILEFSEETIIPRLDKLVAQNPEFTKFVNYLKASSLHDVGAKTIKGVSLGTSYTFLIPNEEAMNRAIAIGLLPNVVNPGSAVDKEKIEKFILYHILARVTVAPDKHQDVLAAQTLYKDNNDEIVSVVIENNPLINELVIVDKNSFEAKVINDASVNLADRSLIHLIDNYLNYSE